MAFRNGLIKYPEMKTNKDFAFFVASQVFQLSEEVNNIRYSSYFGYNTPIKSTIFVSDVGKTSICVTVQTCDAKTGVTLMTNITKLVAVSRSTRKPMPVGGEDLKGTEKHFEIFPRKTIDRRKLQPIPANAFSLTVTALHSDGDTNGHVTQTSYVKWSSDGASLAAVRKHLKNFTRHIELYPWRSIEKHHFGEALVGDELLVSVWEDESNEKQLHVTIERNRKVIFTMDLTVGDGPVTAVLPHLNSML